MGGTPLLSLPPDILVLLPNFIHNIEDYKNLSSTCRTLRRCMESATPNTILRMAAAQSTTFFRPDPLVLVAATARELGNWARNSDENEAALALKLENGAEALLDLAVEHCGLTMERIRELFYMRFSTFNPVTDIIDKCVGDQWYATPDFWDGGVSDAYTIHSEPHLTLFHLAIYGELFGPDFETVLNQDTETRRLSVETRLEFVKYVITDFATTCYDGAWRNVEVDPRRIVKPTATGPYQRNEHGRIRETESANHNLALTWTLQSSRWRPHWKQMRAKAGPDFQDDYLDDWHYIEEDHAEQNWRQRMWEAIMVCQGLDGLAMMRPELQDKWIDKVKEWREKISKLEREPELIHVGRQATLDYPWLLGDLRICASGYVSGT